MSANHDRRYPIPVARNLAAIALATILYIALLYFASRTERVSAMLGYGALFAIVMIPVYSLIHEAEHNMLHPRPAWNDFLGRWLCILFIAPFTFFKHCHLRHHVKNRTDLELWDLYAEGQSRWKRVGTLYLIMGGVGYLSLWLAVLLFALAPGLVYCGFFQRHAEVAGFLEGSNQPAKVATMQRESLVVLAVQALLVVTLKLHALPWLILFAMHGIVWSSQNYVNHAFSPRDIVNGAHNLGMPAWLRPVYLNFNLHLAHHQNPRIPWCHLPGFAPAAPERISFFRNYLRLWRGPRLTTERNPALRADPAG